MNKILEFRQSANLTQRELSERVAITQGALGHYETGQRTPKLNTARKIIAVFNQCGVNCTFEDIFPVEN